MTASQPVSYANETGVRAIGLALYVLRAEVAGSARMGHTRPPYSPELIEELEALADRAEADIAAYWQELERSGVDVAEHDARLEDR